MHTQPTGPSSQVELSLSARKLADRDVLSKSDPLCIVYRGSADGAAATREIGRTETVWNCLSPQWNKKIALNYYFEAKQPLVLLIYDIDSKSERLDDQDFLGLDTIKQHACILGAAECDLADIVAAPNGYLVLKLTGAKFVRGHLIVCADEIDNGQRQVMDFRVQAVQLAKKSLFTKPDPFVEFYRFLADGSRQLAYRSPSAWHTVNPEWPPFSITAQALSGNDLTQDFLVECYANRANGSHKFIGSCRTTLDHLNTHKNLVLPLRNERKTRKGDAPFGSLRFARSTLRREYSFVEYISGGLQLDFGVSVDLTASNGPVDQPNSLHYIQGSTPNQYELAIRAVLEICQKYNHRRIFDAMGFGARLPPNYTVSHLFPLNLDTHQSQVYGVDGVLDAYKRCLHTTQLYGPTNFEPTIQEFAGRARLIPRDGTRYQILLIITDGIVTDMAKTKAAIVNASELPLSIIIVGVGTADFDKMDQLDSDDGLLEAGGRVAKRDIVQFVPFRNFMPSTYAPTGAANYEEVKSRLAAEVLAEVPAQVTSYMSSVGAAARPAPVVPPTLHSQSSLELGIGATSSHDASAPPLYPTAEVAAAAGTLPYPSAPPPSNPSYGLV